MKQFLSVNDVTQSNSLTIDQMIASALQYKKNPLMDEKLGQGKRMGLLFFNPSMRTRLSTQIAAKNLGMEAIILNVGSEGWAIEFGEGAVMNGTTVEHIKDAAPIFGAYFDVLCVRTFPKLLDREEDMSEQAMKAFVHYSKLPVISLESTTVHPLQSLADLITIEENLAAKPAARKPKIVLTWAPHIKSIPQCVANSFAQWVNAWNVDLKRADFVIANPVGYDLAKEFTGKTRVTHNQAEALEGADYVYVKNWSSYEQYGKVLGAYPEWMLTEKTLAQAPNARVMHCLPLRRNVELSDEVLDGPRSLLTQQATNRIWSAQSVISEVLKGIAQK